MFEAEKWPSIRIWASLTRAKLWFLYGLVRAMIIWSSFGAFIVNSGPKKDEWWTSDQGHGPEKLTDAWWDRRLAHVIMSYCKLTLLKKMYAGSRCPNAQCITVYCVQRCIAAEQWVSKLTPVHSWKHQQWAHEHQDLTMEEWKKAAWSNKSHFALHHVDSQVCVGRLPGCSVGKWQSSREFDALGNVLLENLGSCRACGCY